MTNTNAFALAETSSPDTVQACAEPRIDVAACVRRAVERNGQHKEAAHAAGYEPDMWTKILSNDRGIILARLGSLPLAMQREIISRWGAVLGMQIERRDSEVKRAVLQKYLETGKELLELL